jgi:alpha-tubulin suppressor-like RCC1 family protein
MTSLSIDLLRIIGLYNPKVLLRTAGSDISWTLNTKIVFGNDIEKKTIKCVDEQMWKLLYKYLSDDVKIQCGGMCSIINIGGKLYGCGNGNYGLFGIIGNHKNKFKRIKGISDCIVDVKCKAADIFIKNSMGKIYVCGHNVHGQLGIGKLKTIHEFEKIENIPSDIVEIACGGGHTILRDDGGKLYGCGNNESYQLGFDDGKIRYRFEEIAMVPDNIIKVVCGIYMTIILDASGRLYMRGIDSPRLPTQGNGFEEMKNVPSEIIDIACGDFHVIIRTRNGKLYGKGNNHSGQLGFETRQVINDFEELKNVPENVIDVICGSSHSIVRTDDGDIYVCGDNSYKQLGLVGGSNGTKFKKIGNAPKYIVDITCVECTMIIRDINGNLYGCGNNYFGQLGLGDTNMRFELEKIELAEI